MFKLIQYMATIAHEDDTAGRDPLKLFVWSAKAHHHKLLKSNSAAQFAKKMQAFAVNSSDWFFLRQVDD